MRTVRVPRPPTLQNAWLAEPVRPKQITSVVWHTGCVVQKGLRTSTEGPRFKPGHGASFSDTHGLIAVPSP